MSNECSNRIEIIGDKDVITRMFEVIKSEERNWGVVPDPNKSEEENRIPMGLEFDFNKVIPYPQEFKVLDDAYEKAKANGVPWSELPESGYKLGGFKWCDDHWGTGGNATNASAWFTDRKNIHKVENFRLSDYEKPACAVIYYTTVYSPALPVTKTLSERYPELTFKHAYEEEGLIGKGYQVWKAGTLLSEKVPRRRNMWG